VQVRDDHAVVLVMDAAQRVHHHLRIHRVEAGNGFIGQDDARVLHQGAGNRDALLLAARQGLGPLGGLFGDAQPVKNGERLEHIVIRPEAEHRGQGGAMRQRAMQDVRHDIHARHEVELLEDHRALALPIALGRAGQAKDVAPVEQNLALRGVRQTVHDAQKGGFARTRPPDHADEAGAFDREADVIDGGFCPEEARYLSDVQQHGIPRHLPSGCLTSFHDVQTAVM
jgi:hypothetical protein